MKVLLRTAAVIFVVIALFLLTAVVNALVSDGGARAGVAVAYVAGALLLGYLAVWMWRRSAAEPTTTPPPSAPPSA